MLNCNRIKSVSNLFLTLFFFQNKILKLVVHELDDDMAYTRKYGIRFNFFQKNLKLPVIIFHLSSETQLVNHKLKIDLSPIYSSIFFSKISKITRAAHVLFNLEERYTLSSLLTAFPTDCGISNTSLTYLSSDQSTIIKSLLFRFSKRTQVDYIRRKKKKKRYLNVLCFF